MAGHEFKVEQIPALRLVQVAATVADASRIAAVVGPLFTRLAGGLAAAGVAIPAESVATYSTDDTGRIRLTAGYPVSVEISLPPEGDSLQQNELQDAELVELPEHEKAVTLAYVGPISGIGAAWAGLFQWMTDRGYRACAPCREVYLTADQTDPEQWQIELQQPVH